MGVHARRCGGLHKCTNTGTGSTNTGTTNTVIGSREFCFRPRWPYEEFGSRILGIFGVEHGWIPHVTSALERQIPNLLPSIEFELVRVGQFGPSNQLYDLPFPRRVVTRA